MKLPRPLLTIAATGIFFCRSHEAVEAATATANLSVSATISSNCTITTASVGFPSYDPVVAHATSPDDSTSGSVTITCTKGTIPSIGLGLGANASGSQMRMSNGSASYLAYALYQDAGRTTVWGDSGSLLFYPGPATSKDPRTYPVYGRIPAGQDLPAGTYTDTVTATVNF
jgi:spore coat protein U-like protein